MNQAVMQRGDRERTAEPIKLVLERRVKGGARAQFEEWLSRLMQSAARQPSLQGSSVLTTIEGEYFILLRFASEQDLASWQESPQVRELLLEGDAYGTASRAPAVRMGLETWFTLPGVSQPLSAPPKWKMALVTWLALLPQVIVLSFVVPRSWPFPLGIMASTAIPVAMLAWVIMPRLTRWLYRWLYAVDRAQHGQAMGS